MDGLHKVNDISSLAH